MTSSPKENTRDEKFELPIVGADLSCLKCNVRTSITFNPPIMYNPEFIDQKSKLICPTCNNTYSSIPLFSVEVWRTLVKTKYEVLKKVIEENVPQLWLPIEFILSIKSIMNIEGVTLPWFGILLGRPSSLKTAAIETFKDAPDTFFTDIFTPKAFVSNSTALKKELLKDIDMLPKIRNKLFLVSEMSSMFTKKDDELQETLGILTRLADGHGLKTNTGAHGERGYPNIYFNMIGAAVDIPHKVYKYLGFLGPKLYFLRLPKTSKTEDNYVNELEQDEYPSRFQKVREALANYLDILAKCPNTKVEEGSKLMKIPWSKNDDTTAKRYIVKLAMLLSHLRAVVPTWDTAGHGGTEYAYATAIREEPDRAITQLLNIARGHALMQTRNYITLDDIPLVVKVVLSTASIDRVNIFDLLIAHKGKLTTSIIEDSLNMSSPTARKTMIEFKAIELVDLPKSKTKTEELTITLKDNFDWFLGEEFSSLRQEFLPTDNIGYLKKPGLDSNQEVKVEVDEQVNCLKEKSPPTHECTKNELTYECYYCKYKCRTTAKEAYENHIVMTHPGKPAYPNRASIREYGLQPQGKDWEN